MDKQFTKVMKGITITMVFFSHLGNANNVRLFAPLGGAIFLILSGDGLNESAKKGFQAKRFWIKRITTVIVPYFLQIENVWQDKDLLYTLWKCNVQSWISNPALDRSD